MKDHRIVRILCDREDPRVRGYGVSESRNTMVWEREMAGSGLILLFLLTSPSLGDLK